MEAVEGVGWALLVEGVETLWDLLRLELGRAAMVEQGGTVGLVEEREPEAEALATP